MKALHLVLAAALVALPYAAAADDGATTGSVEIGGRAVDVEDSPDLAAEYLTTDDGVVFDLSLETFQSWGALALDVAFVDSDDQSGALHFDLSRMVRSHTTYDKLLHRLGADPLHNLEATSIDHKVVWHDNLSPGAEYGYTYSDLRHRTEIQLPNLKALTLAVELRDQRRDGHVQAFHLSHCDNCHISSEAHRIDEKTTDGTLEAQLAFKGGMIRAAVTSRQHEQGVPNLIYQYDTALHPEQQTPVFDNRLQYDSDEGPLVVDLWPDIDKDILRLDVAMADVGGFAVKAGGVWSETENRYTGLKSDYTGYVVTAVRKLGEDWRLRWRGRVYSIENDDVFVDTVERVTPAGPHAGQTYEDVYGVNYDSWRLSALNRDAFESKLDLSYRFGGRAGTLRFLWDHETLDREYAEVAPGTTDTAKNVLGVVWRGRPSKSSKLEAALRYGDVSNPYMLVDGACSTLVSGRYTAPWDPAIPQYDDQHQTRIADTTASPDEWLEAKLLGSVMLGTTTMSATYSWWDGANSSGDLTDWSRTNQTLTATVWSAPAPTWDWYLAYAWQDSEVDAPACIPVFNG